MLIVVVAVALIVVIGLGTAFLMDRRARRRRDEVRTSGQMQADIRDTRRDLRAWDRAQRLGMAPRRR